jgi:hypothetical protein
MATRNLLTDFTRYHSKALGAWGQFVKHAIRQIAQTVQIVEIVKIVEVVQVVNGKR